MKYGRLYEILNKYDPNLIHPPGTDRKLLAVIMECAEDLKEMMEERDQFIEVIDQKADEIRELKKALKEKDNA